MKRYLTAALCLAVMTFVIGCGGKSGKSGKTMPEKTVHSTPASYIEITESIKERAVSDTIQMGRIREGETVKNTVALINSTREPMIVLNVEVSCGCTQVQFDKHPVQPADTLMLTFEFDSRGFSGFQNKNIKVNTSLATNPCTIILLGEVAPAK